MNKVEIALSSTSEINDRVKELKKRYKETKAELLLISEMVIRTSLGNNAYEFLIKNPCYEGNILDGD